MGWPAPKAKLYHIVEPSLRGESSETPSRAVSHGGGYELKIYLGSLAQDWLLHKTTRSHEFNE